MIKAKYRLHFLRSEKDQPAVHMLHESLLEMDKQFPHAGIKSALESISRNPRSSVKIGSFMVFEIKEKSEEGHRIKLSDISTMSAINLFNHFLFENALADFQRAAAQPDATDMFFTQRCDCYFMFDDLPNAYSMALQSQNQERIFLMALAVGKFDVAISKVPVLVHSIRNNRHEIVSIYELVQLLILAYLSQKPLDDTIKLYTELTSYQTKQEYPVITNIIACLKDQKYADAMMYTSEVNILLSESIFTTSVANDLTLKIRDNIVAIAVKPYARISLGKIVDLTGLGLENVIVSLKRGIRSGVIFGKLDLKESILSCEEVGDQRDQRIVLDKVQIVLEELELSRWKTK
jgi:hypothetical protein